MFLTLKLAENISLKIADALEFPLTKSSLQNSISTYNVKTLKEVVNLNLHDFGIFLELEPDEEEKQQLEANIQIALQAKNIDVEDAIDLRQIKNLKLANQMLKIKRKQRQNKNKKINKLIFKLKVKLKHKLQKKQLWQKYKNNKLYLVLM